MSRTTDLRSDTVTQPGPEMRRAMAEAMVGEDLHHEDTTVNRLEERVAQLLGKEAALFVPTGTMGNLIALKVHTQPGQEVILEERSHIYEAEMGLQHFVVCLPGQCVVTATACWRGRMWVRESARASIVAPKRD